MIPDQKMYCGEHFTNMMKVASPLQYLSLTQHQRVPTDEKHYKSKGCGKPLEVHAQHHSYHTG